VRKEDREKFEEKVRNSGWYRLIGMSPYIGNGKAVVELEIESKHKQALGTAHGGVIASILDSAAGLSVNSYLIKQNKIAVTAEMNISYLKPVKEGKLIAEGKIISSGSRLLVAYSEAKQNDELVAICTATYYVVDDPNPVA
jgi:acyl-CoA thioesterase